MEPQRPAPRVFRAESHDAYPADENDLRAVDALMLDIDFSRPISPPLTGDVNAIDVENESISEKIFFERMLRVEAASAEPIAPANPFSHYATIPSVANIQLKAPHLDLPKSPTFVRSNSTTDLTTTAYENVLKQGVSPSINEIEAFLKEEKFDEAIAVFIDMPKIIYKEFAFNAIYSVLVSAGEFVRLKMLLKTVRPQNVDIELFQLADRLINDRLKNPDAYLNAFKIYRELESPAWREALFIKMMVNLDFNNAVFLLRHQIEVVKTEKNIPKDVKLVHIRRLEAAIDQELKTEKNVVVEHVLAAHLAANDIVTPIHIIKNLCPGIDVQRALFMLGRQLLDSGRMDMFLPILFEIPSKMAEFQQDEKIHAALCEYCTKILSARLDDKYLLLNTMFPTLQPRFEQVAIALGRL